MAEPRKPEPALLFLAVMYSPAADLEHCRLLLESALGLLVDGGCDYAFDFSNYYQREMGVGLRKCLWFSGQPQERQSLLPSKLTCLEVERRLAGKDGKRRVNLDPGLLAPENLVLASTKPRGHRVYLGQGIWAEATLEYRQGGWREFPWTYPDYRQPQVQQCLERHRRRLLGWLRRKRAAGRETRPCSTA